MKASQTLASVAAEVGALEAKVDSQASELSRLRRAVDGNVLLVRHDGFSRPMFIEPRTPGFGFEAFPHFVASFEHAPRAGDGIMDRAATYVPYKRIEFRDTGRADGFGRRVFEEI